MNTPSSIQSRTAFNQQSSAYNVAQSLLLLNKALPDITIQFCIEGHQEYLRLIYNKMSYTLKKAMTLEIIQEALENEHDWRRPDGDKPTAQQRKALKALEYLHNQRLSSFIRPTHAQRNNIPFEGMSEVDNTLYFSTLIQNNTLNYDSFVEPKLQSIVESVQLERSIQKEFKAKERTRM